MRLTFFLLAFCLLAFAPKLQAQTYNNSWIKYNQPYYKLKVSKEGVYRIDSAVLASAGIAVNQLNPFHLQLFNKGNQVPVYVHGEMDGAFNNGDYIEFYAKGNDGWLDSALYGGFANPNTYFSLFNDTAAYFLTIHPTVNGLRYSNVNDQAFLGYNPAPFLYRTEIKTFGKEYFAGETDYYGGTASEYTKAEAFGDNAMGPNEERTYSLPLQQFYSAGPASEFSFFAMGASRAYGVVYDHQLQWSVKLSDGTYQQLYDSTFYGYQPLTAVRSFSSALVNNTIHFKAKSVAQAGVSYSRTAVNWLRVRYPRLTDASGLTAFDFELPDESAQTQAFLELKNASFTTPVYVYDFTNRKRIQGALSGSTAKFLIPNGGGLKHCFVFEQKQIQTVTKLQPVGVGGFFTDYTAVGNDSLYIIVSHPKLWSAAQKYQQYRQSIQGGNYDVLLANVQELYDQFAFGIEGHPWSIRNFITYGLSKWSKAPGHLFLVGKSVYAYVGRSGNPQFQYNLVPSFGYPPSDVMLTAGITDLTLRPAIPIGRISAVDNQELEVYLDKVKEYEAQAPAPWMKNVLHFGGGNAGAEGQMLAGFLTNFENIIEDTTYGAKVHTFLKNTAAPIQINISDSVRSLIAGGTSLLTFFGHSSGQTFDQNLDQPGTFNNKGKYPLMIANSCYAGDIHLPYEKASRSNSEEFVLEPEKGVIGFLASVHLGIPYALNIYTEELYRNLSHRMYGKTFGQCMQYTIQQVQGYGSDDILTTCREMTLHGDPAIHLNYWPKPDYAVMPKSISWYPENVSTEQDSFDVHLVVRNYGKAIGKQVPFELKRIFPDGTESLHGGVFKALNYLDSVLVRLPVGKQNGAGLNRFELRIDPLNQFDELLENNNVLLNTSMLIRSGDVIPVYPYPYAIVPDNTPTIKASTGNVLEQNRTYVFELDTTDSFNSPFKLTQTVTQAGGVVEAKPGLWSASYQLKDTVVYYWRVRRDVADTLNFPWRTSSFQYQQNKNGWGQSHFQQYKQNSLAYLNMNQATGVFTFTPAGRKLTVNTYGQSPDNFVYNNFYDCYVKLDLNNIEMATCGYKEVLLVTVIEPLTFKPWQTRWFNATTGQVYNPARNFGNANDWSNCRGRAMSHFVYDYGNATQLKGLERLLDTVPQGHYIVMTSFQTSRFNSIAYQPIKQQLYNLGATQIMGVKDSVPYVFFVKKGFPQGAIEVVGDSTRQTIALDVDLISSNNYGSMASVNIGPAMRWDSVSWLALAKDALRDSMRIEITGRDASNNEFVFKTFDLNDNTSARLDQINASQFPQLKMNFYAQDDSLLTPVQLKKWQVFYQPAPELALNPVKGFVFKSDTVQQGEQVQMQVMVENIGKEFMDSVKIKYWMVDNAQNLQPLGEKFIPPLAAGENYLTDFTTSSNLFVGANTLWAEVNPQHQAAYRYEQFHFNNILSKNFVSFSDRVNPVLDVTFDGMHILNKDIVSPTPKVVIKLMDENKFVPLNDTNNLAVYLKRPNSSMEEKLYHGAQLQFVPGTIQDNVCKLLYNPTYTQDGIYELRVQAKDKANNLSGINDYRIQFEVVNKATISQVMNYPNPFSTSTRFVFTLTGSKVPQDMKIQIMTVTGKVVREIMGHELGTIRIGRNVTDYAWDGKDEFGDQLANGVYLYRVITQNNGEQVELMKTNADAYFKEGFGKMYLLR